MSDDYETDDAWRWRATEALGGDDRSDSDTDGIDNSELVGQEVSADPKSSEDELPAWPQFSLALMFELKVLLGVLMAVPLIGRALFTAAVIMLIFILVQLPFFWLFGAFRRSSQDLG